MPGGLSNNTHMLQLACGAFLVSYCLPHLLLSEREGEAEITFSCFNLLRSERSLHLPKLNVFFRIFLALGS